MFYLKTVLSAAALLFFCYGASAKEASARHVAEIVKEKGGEIFLYKERTLYHLEVGVYTNTNEAFLKIKVIETNYKFEENPNDQIAKKLLLGEPRILNEKHFSDSLSDETLDLYVERYIDGTGAHRGWTQEESWSGEVQDRKTIYVYRDKYYFTLEEGWKSTPESLWSELQKKYEHHLQEVVTLLH